MSPHRPHRRPATPHPAGFSLVELLMVVAVIAVLVALLLPAIGAVRTRAALAQVSVNIKSLETGIATFKTEFGVEPPSSITLSESPSGWPVASRSIIRGIWPQFDFNLYRDINGDGDMLDGSGIHDPSGTPSDLIVLNGAECLVFFLGGVAATNMVDSIGNAPPAADPPGSTLTPVAWTPLGFSRNPRDPFERSGGTRIGPLTEFDGSRFTNAFNTGPNVGIPEYLDPLSSQSKPYLYASSYGGKGYDSTSAFADMTGPVNPLMANVYLQKLGSTPAASVPWNKTGYQIISPGFDNEYGVGGLFGVADNFQLDPATQKFDRDNITNFSSGQLND